MRSSTTADQVADATEVEQENAVTGANDGGPTFEGHVKSLFRERDRAAMLDFFDLWSVRRRQSKRRRDSRGCSNGLDAVRHPVVDEKVDLLERLGGQWHAAVER
jgi:hypothetical protein